MYNPSSNAFSDSGSFFYNMLDLSYNLIEPSPLSSKGFLDLRQVLFNICRKFVELDLHIINLCVGLGEVSDGFLNYRIVIGSFLGKGVSHLLYKVIIVIIVEVRHGLGLKFINLDGEGKSTKSKSHSFIFYYKL